MTTTIATTCPRCGRRLDGSELACSMCGQLLRKEARPAIETDRSGTRPESANATSPTRTHAIVRVEHEQRIHDAPEAAWQPWLYLAIGLVTAPVFGFTPILQFMGWFLASLVHEMGHATVAWLCGMPAMPAISLAGHAAAVHQEQSKFLLALVVLGLATLAWKFLAGAWRWVAIGIVATVLPAVALTEAR